MVSKSGAALSRRPPHRPSGGACVIPLPGAEADLALVRAFSHKLKIACDELHDDPFNADARAHLVQLILEDSKNADAAQNRLRRSTRTPAVRRP